MQLSKADNLKSRVLMAKANIPFIKISSEFIERFPKYIGEEERVKNMLLLRKCSRRNARRFGSVLKTILIMREIKFRVWDVKLSKWINPTYNITLPFPAEHKIIEQFSGLIRQKRKRYLRRRYSSLLL